MSGPRDSGRRGFGAFLARPALDVFYGLERCIVGGVPGLVLVLVGLAVGWWVYAPLHELLHAAGCVVTGGSISKLEISAIYGGGLLQKIFPFVVAESEYAGRLSGFDTGGSDLVYLATDLAPFLLTLFPGVWWMRRAAATGRGWLFGLSLPFALAPFMSLTGDAYEIGSIVLTRIPPWSSEAMRALIRGDDIVKKVVEIRAAAGAAAWSGGILAAGLGAVWAWAWWGLADRVARVLGRAAITPLPSVAPHDAA